MRYWTDSLPPSGPLNLLIMYSISDTRITFISFLRKLETGASDSGTRLVSRIAGGLEIVMLLVQNRLRNKIVLSQVEAIPAPVTVHILSQQSPLCPQGHM